LVTNNFDIETEFYSKTGALHTLSLSSSKIIALLLMKAQLTYHFNGSQEKNGAKKIIGLNTAMDMLVFPFGR